MDASLEPRDLVAEMLAGGVWEKPPTPTERFAEGWESFNRAVGVADQAGVPIALLERDFSDARLARQEAEAALDDPVVLEMAGDTLFELAHRIDRLAAIRRRKARWSSSRWLRQSPRPVRVFRPVGRARSGRSRATVHARSPGSSDSSDDGPGRARPNVTPALRASGGRP